MRIVIFLPCFLSFFRGRPLLDRFLVRSFMLLPCHAFLLSDARSCYDWSGWNFQPPRSILSECWCWQIAAEKSVGFFPGLAWLSLSLGRQAAASHELPMQQPAHLQGADTDSIRLKAAAAISRSGHGSGCMCQKSIQFFRSCQLPRGHHVPAEGSLCW